LIKSIALAFNVTLGSKVFQASQILDIPTSSFGPEASVMKTGVQCAGNFSIAQASINGCNGDPACLCKADVVSNLRSAQECMFLHLISTNTKPSDVRVGSNALMTAYSTSCLNDAKITLAANQTGLTLPPDWDGPFDSVLPLGGTVVAVIAGGFLGFSALLLLSNMS
ncbi:hypothetical protein AN958_10812, partial [Leucoagaricus sp. SymC.cos]